MGCEAAYILKSGEICVFWVFWWTSCFRAQGGEVVVYCLIGTGLTPLVLLLSGDLSRVLDFRVSSVVWIRNSEGRNFYGLVSTVVVENVVGGKYSFLVLIRICRVSLGQNISIPEFHVILGS